MKYAFLSGFLSYDARFACEGYQIYFTPGINKALTFPLDSYGPVLYYDGYLFIGWQFSLKYIRRLLLFGRQVGLLIKKGGIRRGD